MIVHEGYNSLNLRTPSVTLGIFDGVHRGHMTLLKRLTDSAEELNGESVVITFSPHPKLVLDKETKSLFFLTTFEEKRILLEKAGVGHLVVIHFDREFSSIPACDFVKKILVDRVGTNHLILGFNHHFGTRGEGDYNTIKECAAANNFTVEQAQGLHTEEGIISSSLIRDALMNGRLDDANKWLGYNYTLTGLVVKGRQLGRVIGFPTANIKPDSDHKLVPGTGVYAVDVIVGGSQYPGMMSIGTNPTVNNNPFKRTIEVHILGFSDDIYGKKISVGFKKRLRNEVRFNNTEELSRQMELDKHQVILLFSGT